MTITPRSLDEARRLLPGVGVSVYAMTPGGSVTLELLEEGLPGEPPQAITWEAPTERACWEKAFPAADAEPVEQNRFTPSEGSRARVELAAAVSDPAAELVFTASTVGGLFDYPSDPSSDIRRPHMRVRKLTPGLSRSEPQWRRPTRPRRPRTA